MDTRKHPVSLLYEYCSMQNIQPVFEFYEIPQKIGIEYGCIATVENFVGMTATDFINYLIIIYVAL